jgi:hypothetical protein
MSNLSEPKADEQHSGEWSGEPADPLDAVSDEVGEAMHWQRETKAMLGRALRAENRLNVARAEAMRLRRGIEELYISLGGCPFPRIPITLKALLDGGP